MALGPKTPMALYKANLELVLRLGALLHEQRRQWSVFGSASVGAALERTLAQTEKVLTSNDWSQLMAMPGNAFWRSLRAEPMPVQASIEKALQCQDAFAQGLKDAFAQWQQQSADALGTDTAPWTLASIMQAFEAPASQAKDGTGSATKARSRKAAGSARKSAGRNPRKTKGK